MDKNPVAEQLGQVEKLILHLEQHSDPGVRESATELVGTLFEIHRAALEGILRRVPVQETDAAWVQELGDDPLVGSVLLLHGLHPATLETRVAQALERVRPVLHNHKGDVELIGIRDGSVHLRLKGTCNGCPSSQSTFKNLIETAIYDSAPEVEKILIEGVAAEPKAELHSGSKERCELCAEKIGGRHRHLIEPVSRKLLCVCDACSIVFCENGTTKYRRIPLDIRRLEELALPDQSWEKLLIPINLAFFYKSSAAGRVIALYPSRTGVTESSLEFEEWSGLEKANPLLEAMRSDVEAFVINRLHEKREYYVAPIDRCFELVGLVRKHWEGFTGGDRVRSELDLFFTRLREGATA